MVRISGGKYRGRQLRVPRAGVRPTKDMVRQALFSVLGESLGGKRVLDVFAGSGVIGLEALSRGAGEATWVESDSHTFKLLQQNVAEVAGAGMSKLCFRGDAIAWLKSPAPPRGFDLVVADPPYEPELGLPWGTVLLDVLTDSVKLKPDGLFVLEQRVDQPIIDNPGWNRLKEGRYGETRLIYYRRKTPPEEPPA